MSPMTEPKQTSIWDITNALPTPACPKKTNYTSGSIYYSVISKERRGDYLGGTVQVIPHITDEIKACIRGVVNGVDIVIVEVGGTVGDIESLPFLEAIRQFRNDVGKENALYIHVTLVPFMKTSENSRPNQPSTASRNYWASEFSPTFSFAGQRKTCRAN